MLPAAATETDVPGRRKTPRSPLSRMFLVYNVSRSSTLYRYTSNFIERRGAQQTNASLSSQRAVDASPTCLGMKASSTAMGSRNAALKCGFLSSVEDVTHIHRTDNEPGRARSTDPVFPSLLVTLRPFSHLCEWQGSPSV